MMRRTELYNIALHLSKYNKDNVLIVRVDFDDTSSAPNLVTRDSILC